MMHAERITPIVKLNLKLQSSDAYILVSGTISVAETSAEGAAASNSNSNTTTTTTTNNNNNNNNNKKVVFKNCAPFTDCISEINNSQMLNAMI